MISRRRLGLHRWLLIGALVLVAGLVSVAALQPDDAVGQAKRSSVLIIGDSHTVAEVSYLHAFKNFTVNAEIGRASSAALGALREKLQRSHRIVVFDIATNDYYNPSGFKDNLEQVLRAIGRRQLILVSSHVGCGSANKASGVSEVIRKFAIRNDGQVRYVDWAGYVSRHPGVHAGDCIHFDIAGYKRRLAMIMDAIRAVK